MNPWRTVVHAVTRVDTAGCRSGVRGAGGGADLHRGHRGHVRSRHRCEVPPRQPGDGVLTVSWRPPPGATGYRVQWKSGTTETFATVAADGRQRIVTGATATNVVIRSLTNGTAYTVRVIAFNSVRDGPPSQDATGTPQTPPAQVTGVTAAEGDGTVTVSRNAATRATGYRVQMARTHLQPRLIFGRRVDFLIEKRIEVPGAWRLSERVRAGLRAHKSALIHLVDTHLTPDLRQMLDDLSVQEASSEGL